MSIKLGKKLLTIILFIRFIYADTEKLIIESGDNSQSRQRAEMDRDKKYAAIDASYACQTRESFNVHQEPETRRCLDRRTGRPILAIIRGEEVGGRKCRDRRRKYNLVILRSFYNHCYRYYAISLLSLKQMKPLIPRYNNQILTPKRRNTPIKINIKMKLKIPQPIPHQHVRIM